MRSCSDVHNFLLEQGVAHEIVHLPALSTTAKKAASLLGVPLTEVCKSLVFVTEKGPVLALVPGDLNASPRLLRAAFSCRRATLAKPDEVREMTGYRPGAVPPCGLAQDMPVVADERLRQSAVVYCGGGTSTTMLKIRSEDLLAMLGARVAVIADHPED
jgi:prolyl-tRNA editing enzyme YbaK/EbsC (Cys-tRNA(Pro) deacylase)